MTGEQVRWGLENLNLTQKKLDALGFRRDAPGVRPAAPTTWAPSWARVHTWDGSKWNLVSDWYQADEQIIKPLVKSTAEKYAPRRRSRRDAGGLPELTHPRRGCAASPSRGRAGAASHPGRAARRAPAPRLLAHWLHRCRP
jgi:hypothetical protein